MPTQDAVKVSTGEYAINKVLGTATYIDFNVRARVVSDGTTDYTSTGAYTPHNLLVYAAAAKRCCQSTL